MKNLLTLVLLVTAVPVADADTSCVNLVPIGWRKLERAIDPMILAPETDPLILYIDAKGNLGSEGEQVSLLWLDQWIKKTSKYERPAVALELSSKTPSNSDLPKIQRILDFLTARKALYQVSIRP